MSGDSFVAGTCAEIDWRPTALAESLALRAQVNRTLREFFHARGVLEVETPVLSTCGNTDPNIESFHVEFSGRTDGQPRRRFLRTSPEFPLKRLLASGVGDCYELGRVFRDGEAGGRHNPEFTMLEWYRVGMDANALAAEAVEVLQACIALTGPPACVVETTYRDLFIAMLNVDPHLADIEMLRSAAGAIHIEPSGLTRDDWLDLLMTHRIQPTFPAQEIHVIHDFPASQCALARVRPGETPVAERFEVFIGSLEVANGYHELADAQEQGRRFSADVARRRSGGSFGPPVDARLLGALAHGMPDCSGVAVGVDRVLMHLLGTPRIADVLAFDFANA